MVKNVTIIHAAIVAIVVTVLVLTFIEGSEQYQALQAFCDAHNGTLQAGTHLYCELPNGTKVSVPEGPL